MRQRRKISFLFQLGHSHNTDFTHWTAYGQRLIWSHSSVKWASRMSQVSQVWSGTRLKCPWACWTLCDLWPLSSMYRGSKRTWRTPLQGPVRCDIYMIIASFWRMISDASSNSSKTKIQVAVVEVAVVVVVVVLVEVVIVVQVLELVLQAILQVK